MKCLAIIPARSGSKGLKDKNIKEINGKPLMAYTIDAAKESEIFYEVMVSTDSEKYAQIAKKCGANVPFLREQSTAGDTASSWDVVKEVLYNYKKRGEQFDIVCLLQPTSPLRNTKHILQAYNLLIEKNANSIVSVCKLGHSLNICNTLPEDNSLVGFIHDEDRYLRQMNPIYYRLNGAIYFVNVNAFMQYGTIYKEKSYAYIMDEIDSIDIDTQEDLLLAEYFLKK